MHRPRRFGRVATWVRADPLHRGPLGPPQSRPQTGAVLRAKMRSRNSLGRREAAPQVALSERSRP
eukprot:9197779-Alexandrium_andersonii.AAC.1